MRVIYHLIQGFLVRSRDKSFERRGKEFIPKKLIKRIEPEVPR